MMNKNNRNRKFNLSKEQLLRTIELKRKCNQTAQDIVVELIEINLTKEIFLSKLKYINPSHYEDIIEERYILQICGYPLCNNKLEKIPSKIYVISCSSNKVYDITDRKKFCSQKCYNASNCIKGQIPTSPLWLRDEKFDPQFKILL